MKLMSNCTKHDHTEKGECLVLELEVLCGKPENHNNGDENDCLECTAIRHNI